MAAAAPTRQVADAVRRLELTVKDRERVADRAAELYRLADVRGVRLGAAEIAKPVACVELACFELGVLVSPTALQRLSMLPKKVYVSGVERLRAALDVRATTLSLRELCVRFGTLPLLDRALSAMEQLREGLEKEGRPADAERPSMVAAVLYACCLHEHVRIDRKQLLDLARCTMREFGTAADTVMRMAHGAVCQRRVVPAEAEGGEQSASPRKRARLATSDGIHTMIPVTATDEAQLGAPVSAASDDYEDWQRALLAKLDEQEHHVDKSHERA